MSNDINPVIPATDVTPAIVLPNLTPDQALAMAQGVRVLVINDLMKGGAVSGENSDRILLTNMLNGMTSQASAAKRLEADKNNADASAATIAALLSAVDKTTIFSRPGDNAQVITDADITISNNVPTPDMVPGELDVVTAPMDYSTFMINNGRDPDSLGSKAIVEEDKDGIEY